MGNKPSCCISGSPVNRRPKSNNEIADRGTNNKGFSRNIFDNRNSIPRKEETVNGNLQHISEREPEDVDEDPSTHPTKGPIFMERSKSEMKIRENRRSFYVLTGQLTNAGPSPPVPLKKSNSCSTIFLDDSTISQPNLKITIKCISLAIFYHIANRKNRGRAVERTMEIFDEALHPVLSEPTPSDYAVRDPDHRHIYRFIRTLFSAAQLTAECAIITLVYIERLLTYAEIDLCPSNWRRVLLGAIMMASKVWDDQAVWNVDYCQILRRCTVEDMNELERQFLECLDFNINVPSSVYAKYYFDLRTLAMANDLQVPLQPLYKEKAKQLEALSKTYEDKYLDSHKKVKKRCNSAERLSLSNKTLKDPTDPRFELSHSDLVRLLSYLEGELQARDIVIAAMKSEKAKQFLYRAKYGHLSLNDPLAALQRDSELCDDNDGFNESSLGKLYENQLAYLERLIVIQRRTHQHAKQVLSFVEKRHNNVIRQLELESKRQAYEIVQGDKICVLLENEREQLKNALERQMQEYQRAQAELIQIKQTLTEERERHKAKISHLQEEQRRLLAEVDGKRSGLDNLWRDKQTDADEKQQAAPKKRVPGIRYGMIGNSTRDSRTLRRLIPNDQSQFSQATTPETLNVDKAPARGRKTRLYGGLGIGTYACSNGIVPCSKPSDALSKSEIATTSIGVDFKLPQQLLHASGILRRSTSAMSSPMQTKRSMLDVARSYITGAAKPGVTKRLSASMSPPMRRWDHVVELHTKPDLSHGATDASSNSNSRRPAGSSVLETSALPMPTKQKKEDLEPEIAELDAVLRSLALLTSFPGVSGSNRVQFPNVDCLVTGEKMTDKNGLIQVNGEENRIEAKENSKEAIFSRRKSSVTENRHKQHQSNGISGIPARHVDKANGTKTENGTMRNGRHRIPVAINKKASEPSNGCNSSKQHQTMTICVENDQEKHAAPKFESNGKSHVSSDTLSPQLALQRKVKAISGFANRIQRRVVAGVVNQVASRQTSSSTSLKKEK